MQLSGARLAAGASREDFDARLHERGGDVAG
jgi:hypothetical protein